MVKVPEQASIDTLLAHRRELASFLEKRVGNRADAEDILQQAFVRGVEHAGEIREGESTIAWFYRVLRNAVVDHHRRRGASNRALEAFAREMEMGSAEMPALETRAAVCACVKRLATTLEPSYADAIQRIEVDGASVKDYAAETGITPNNAAVRVHRAREALRKQVHASCGACATHGCLECDCNPATSHGTGS